MPLSPPGVPPHWLVYFGVEDIDAALAKVAELGGVEARRPDRHPDREDRDREGSAGRRVRALRGQLEP